MPRKAGPERVETFLARRKGPQQRRSELTVQSILQATTQIAEAEGFQKLGTRRIAERAGVSVGSLYQFFPTVEDILLEIYEETASRVANKYRALVLSDMHLPMEIIGEKALRLLLKEYEDNQLFLHQMVIEVPQLMLPPGVATLERLIRAGLRIYFRQFTQLTGKDVDRIAFFLGLVLIGGIRTYVSDRPQQLSKKEFIKDLNKIAQDYVHSHNWHLPN